jgi:hypothetical protein
VALDRQYCKTRRANTNDVGVTITIPGLAAADANAYAKRLTAMQDGTTAGKADVQKFLTILKSSGSNAAENAQLGKLGTPTITHVAATHPAAPSPPSDDGLSGGAIAGIVIGCIFGLAIIIAIIVFLVLRRDDSESKLGKNSGRLANRYDKDGNEILDDMPLPTMGEVKLGGTETNPIARTQQQDMETRKDHLVQI